MKRAITALLQHRPHSAAELAEHLGTPDAIVRNALSCMFFEDKTITCDGEGNYRLGDPTPLLK